MPKAWNLADVAGPKQAKITRPEIIAAITKKAKKPLLVVTTAHTIKTFLEKGYTPVSGDLGLHEVTNLLKDPEWKGLLDRPLLSRERCNEP